MEHELTKKIIIKGEITALSGLHIGGTNTAMEIGGIDSTVIRNPIDNTPYIPGSSLKGKMRSLLEIAEGDLGGKQGKNIIWGPCMDPNSKSAQLFGYLEDKKNKGGKEGEKTQRPSRVIVRDCQFDKNLTKEFENTDLFLAQPKTEVVLDRITAKAMPRTLEQVPKGAKFSLGIVLNVFNGDDEKKLLGYLWQAMKLLQDDYIGGNGSRGYGEIDIKIKSVMSRKKDYYLGEAEESPIEFPDELK